MSPAPEALEMIVDDGPFAGLRFVLPASLTGPQMRVQIIRGPVKAMYRRMEINHANNWVKVKADG